MIDFIDSAKMIFGKFLILIPVEKVPYEATYIVSLFSSQYLVANSLSSTLIVPSI